MLVSVDAAGRLVIPRAFRELLGVARGGQVDIVEVDGTLEVAPAPVDVVLDEGSDGPAVRFEDDRPLLTDRDVRDALEAVRR